MKIGIIGSGVIVKCALESIRKMQTIECVALWYREQDEEAASGLKKEFDIPKLYTSIDAFLNDDDFDVVYIGVINSLHYEFSKKALLAKKHVICEKPFTPTGLEARELIDIAKKYKLFIFEAIMLRYSDNYALIKDSLAKLGDITLIQCNYSQYSRRFDKYLQGIVLPAFDPALAGGCIYDINIYCIHFTMGLFGKPISYKYYPNIGFNGIDTSGILVMDYEKFKAVCVGAKDSESKTGCTIQGTKGCIRVKSIPSQVNDIELTVYNKSNELIGTKIDDLMSNEFLKIKEIIDTKNCQLCYQYMETSFEVMDLVEKARKEAGIV